MQLIFNLIYLYKTLTDSSLGYWQKENILVYINYSLVGTLINKNKLDNKIKACFSVWEKILKGKIKFEFTTINYINADIIINFAPNGFQDNHYLGVCIRSFEENVIKKAQITLSLNSTENIEQTILHEIGHALGLAHSANKKDIMYPQDDPSQNKLSKNDIKIIQLLYEYPFDKKNKPLNTILNYIKRLCTKTYPQLA